MIAMRFALYAVVVLCSCNRQLESRALSKDTMQSVYIALLEEGKQHGGLPADSSRHFNSDSVFQSFGISEEEFRAAIAMYENDPVQWRAFFEGVLQRIEKEKEVQPVEQAQGQD